jgi:putative flavoprotein involved in K+ transport
MSGKNDYDVIVIGGGQAGLSMGFYLRRAGLSYVILDAQKRAGGAWLQGWNSLRLFSPAQWSSLPGWLFPGKPERYPTRDEVVSYLEQYEERYKLPILRPVHVTTVRRPDNEETSARFVIESSVGNLSARAVVSATGSWQKPYIPVYPGQQKFTGTQIHSAHYRSPEEFAGQNVLVVGAGNSGAQIMAEVSLFADATWVTLEEPQFLPDDVDGRVLFDSASEQYRALTQGSDGKKPKSSDLLGHIVMVEPVREGRDRNALGSRRPFARFTKTGVVWEDGSETYVDTVVWCTGFKPALEHLRPLGIVNENGGVETEATRSSKEPNIWLVGYGNWTGFASATLIGVGRSARKTVDEITAALKSETSRQKEES